MAPKKKAKTTDAVTVDAEEHAKFAEALLSSKKYGVTYCEGLQIDLKPGDDDALFQWLCSSLMFSSGLSEKLTTRASRTLLQSGHLQNPAKCKEAAHERFVGLLDHKFQRKEQTATYLHSAAETLLDRYDGSLYKLRQEAKEKPGDERKRLQEIKGLAKTGIDIFFREAQLVWTELQPFVDGRASSAAKKLGLPGKAQDLLALVDGDVEKLARLAASLVRVDLAKADGQADVRKLLAGEELVVDEDEPQTTTDAHNRDTAAVATKEGAKEDEQPGAQPDAEGEAEAEAEEGGTADGKAES